MKLKSKASRNSLLRYLRRRKHRKKHNRKKEFLSNIGWKHYLQPKAVATSNTILLPGYGHDCDSLLTMERRSRELGAHITSLDYPGHGGSLNGGTPWYFKHFLDLVLLARSQVIYLRKERDRRDLPLILIGYSLGSLVGLSLLINYPYLRRRVAGAVSICPPIEVTNNTVPLINDWKRTAMFALNVLSVTVGRKTAPRCLMQKNVPRMEDIKSAQVIDNPASEIVPPNRVVQQIVYHSEYVRDHLSRLSNVPMLVIHPREDHRADFETSQQCFSALDNTTFVELPACVPHYMWGTEYEAEVVNLVGDWTQERIAASRNS